MKRSENVNGPVMEVDSFQDYSVEDFGTEPYLVTTRLTVPRTYHAHRQAGIIGLS